MIESKGIKKQNQVLFRWFLYFPSEKKISLIMGLIYDRPVDIKISESQLLPLIMLQSEKNRYFLPIVYNLFAITLF